MSDQQPGYPPQPPYQGQPPQQGQPPAYQGQPPAYQQQPEAHAPHPPTSSSSLGRVGVILGVIAIALSVLSTLIFQIFVRIDAYQMLGAINWITTLLVFASALAALICGVIALRRPNDSKALAGIATGIGATIVITSLLGFVINTIGSLFYF